MVTIPKPWGPINVLSFVITKWNHLLKKNQGIYHQTSCAVPQQNDVVESKYMHPLNISRSFYFKLGCIFSTSGREFLTTTFFNRLLSPILNGLLLFKMIYKILLKFDNLQVFGCLRFVTKLNMFNKLYEGLKNLFWSGI